MANITDMVFSTGVVLFLVIAGPILSFETDADRDSYAMFLSWSFVALLLSFFMALCLVIALYLRRSFTPRKPYKLFLTHHKYASGSLARFIKCVLSKCPGSAKVQRSSVLAHELKTIRSTGEKAWEMTQNTFDSELGRTRHGA